MRGTPNDRRVSSSTAEDNLSTRLRHPMTPRRFPRILASLGLSMTLALGATTIPVATLGALPTVTVGLGPTAGVFAASGAIPATVKPTEPAGFQVWARNDDSSTVSQFYLSIQSAGTLTTASWTKSNGQSGTCSGTATYDCSFGQVKPGGSVVVTAVITTPTSGSGLGVNFVFSTTGLGSGGGDNSHGDTFPISDSVALNADANFAGRYVSGNTLRTVQTDQVLGSGNRQSTIVYSPTTGIGVTVEDGPGLSGGCALGAACFSETSEIHVGNGSAQYGQFKVIVNLHSSEIPSGVNANNLVVYHDGVPITATCGKTPVADCTSAKKFSWGLQVTIWVHQNGKFGIG